MCVPAFPSVPELPIPQKRGFESHLVGPLPIFCPYPSVYNLYVLYHKRSLMARAFLFLSD